MFYKAPMSQKESGRHKAASKAMFTFFLLPPEL